MHFVIIRIINKIKLMWTNMYQQLTFFLVGDKGIIFLEAKMRYL